jgi:hypothetical protein
MVIAVIGVGVLVVWMAKARPLWVDEEMLALNVRDRTIAGLAGPLWLDQSAPFGWLTLERMLMLAFGTGERVVRALTVTFGIATLFTALRIGRRWMSPIGAAVLVALCAFGQWIVFFTLELKHYSADTFGALLVPAAGAWALDGIARPDRGRLRRWWIVAAIVLWFSNGALFVTPACALLLFACVWYRAGYREAQRFALDGVIFLASFGLCYFVVLRHALANSYLKTYWAFAFPPTSEGATATVRWLAGQPIPFATKPVGSSLQQWFWLTYLIGIGLGIVRRSPLALMFATVPISALALAILHVVPTFERLALWSVPALYVGVALCADAALWLIQRRHIRIVCVPLSLATAFAVLCVAGDIVGRGLRELELRPRSNYGLDDRSSTRWLLANHQQGDAVLTTHYGLAALWWYGRINIADQDRSGRLADGSPMYEIGHVLSGPECTSPTQSLDAALAGHRRAIVYLGFRLNVLPDWFDTFALDELARRGALVGYKEYAEGSRLAIFDLTAAPTRAEQIPPGNDAPRDPAAMTGCVTATAARRW